MNEEQKVTLDISMGQKHLFPYAFLEESEPIICAMGYEFHLYYVLLGNKRRVAAINKCSGVFVVQVENCTTNTVEEVYLSHFGNPSSPMKVLDVSIAYNGNAVVVDCGLGHSFTVHVLKLTPPTSSSDSSSSFPIIDYSVAYIGQSNAQSQSVVDRLKKHEKILEIERDIAKHGLEYDLFILLSGLQAKLVFRNAFPFRMIDVMSGKHPSDSVLVDPKRKAVINIAEAMLINCFQPEYKTQMQKRRHELSCGAACLA